MTAAFTLSPRRIEPVCDPSRTVDEILLLRRAMTVRDATGLPEDAEFITGHFLESLNKSGSAPPEVIATALETLPELLVSHRSEVDRIVRPLVRRAVISGTIEDDLDLDYNVGVFARHLVRTLLPVAGRLIIQTGKSLWQEMKPREPTHAAPAVMIALGRGPVSRLARTVRDLNIPEVYSLLHEFVVHDWVEIRASGVVGARYWRGDGVTGDLLVALTKSLEDPYPDRIGFRVLRYLRERGDANCVPELLRLSDTPLDGPLLHQVLKTLGGD